MFSKTIIAQDSRGAGSHAKLARPVLISQMAQDFKEESTINQIKSKLLKQAPCLLKTMGSVSWTKIRKRRNQRK
jgi:hypothetical protein